MKNGLVAVLQQIINRTPDPNDIDRIIAEYLLQNLYQENITISQIADDCHISKASITRFAQNAGFSGFSELKKSYFHTEVEKSEMMMDFNANEYDLLSENEETELLMSEFEQVAKDISAYNNNLYIDTFKELCRTIHEAHQIQLFSVLIPGHITSMLQHILLTAGKYVNYYPNKYHQLLSVEQLRNDDLAIVISLEGSYVLGNRELMLKIKQSAAKTVLITNNPEMKLSSIFDEVISLGDHGIERSGKYKLMMFVEMLAHQYFNLYAKN